MHISLFRELDKNVFVELRICIGWARHFVIGIIHSDTTNKALRHLVAAGRRCMLNHVSSLLGEKLNLNVNKVFIG